MEPLITIITPTYNSAATINRLIDSIRTQRFRDFEHLILDGQSSDNTVSILQQYASEVPNVTLIVEKDKGIYDAMNKGIDKAKGKWLFFIGSDDYLYTDDVLSKIADVIKGNNSLQLIYGDVWFEKFNRVYDGYFSTNKLLSQNVCHQSIFYHRDLFHKLGQFDLQYKNCADYQFNLLCWLNPEVNMMYTPLVVSFFSEGGVSTTNTDWEFKNNFPYTIVSQTLDSKFDFFEKCTILSDCLRKILLRYKFSSFLDVLLKNKKRFLLLLPSLLLMMVSLPYYLLKNLIKTNK